MNRDTSYIAGMAQDPDDTTTCSALPGRLDRVPSTLEAVEAAHGKKEESRASSKNNSPFFHVVTIIHLYTSQYTRRQRIASLCRALPLTPSCFGSGCSPFSAFCVSRVPYAPCRFSVATTHCVPVPHQTFASHGDAPFVKGALA